MAQSKTTCDATRLTTNRPTKRPTRPNDRLTTTPIDLRTKWAARMHRTKHILLDTCHVCRVCRVCVSVWCVCVIVLGGGGERGQSGACVWKRPACAKHVRWGKCMCVEFFGSESGLFGAVSLGFVWLLCCSGALVLLRLCGCMEILLCTYMYMHAITRIMPGRPLYVMQSPVCITSFYVHVKISLCVIWVCTCAIHVSIKIIFLDVCWYVDQVHCSSVNMWFARKSAGPSETRACNFLCLYM